MYSQSNDHPSENILQEYLDHELAIPDRKILEEHLKICQRCNGKLNSLEKLYSQIKEMPEISLSKDLSSAIIGRIESQPNVNPPFPRWVVFTQILVAVIAITSFPYNFSLDINFPDLSRFQISWFSNVQQFFNSIPNGISSLYQSVLEVDFIFSFRLFFSSSDFLSSGYILLLTISAGLLWVVGNKILLSNLNQNKFNGG